MPIRLLALAGAGLLALLASRGLSEVIPAGPAPAPAAPGPRLQLQGAGSCAAAACHNAPGPGFEGREYALCLQRDPDQPAQFRDRHAQAYDVLFSDRSRRIEKNLRGLMSEQEARPQHNAQCLRCHVHPDFDREPVRRVDGVRQFRLEDGVSCEACHGAAEAWLAPHVRGPLPSSERLALGLADTRSVPGRVRSCVACHIGGAGEMDVNHDLIAAGHPELRFEFSAFHAALPRHWDPAKDTSATRDPRGRPDFEALAWAVGQVASAQASLRLLAERAADARRPWPEFAEYDCRACHHDLAPTRVAPAPGKAGALAWSPWYHAVLPDALEALGAPANDELDRTLMALRRELERPRPDRKKTSALAEQTVRLLEPWLAEARPGPSVATTYRKLIDRADEQALATRERGLPRILALAALGRALADLGHPPRDLGPVRELSRFPLGFPDAAAYDPLKARQAIQALRR